MISKFPLKSKSDLVWQEKKQPDIEDGFAGIISAWEAYIEGYLEGFIRELLDSKEFLEKGGDILPRQKLIDEFINPFFGLYFTKGANPLIKEAFTSAFLQDSFRVMWEDNNYSQFRGVIPGIVGVKYVESNDKFTFEHATKLYESFNPGQAVAKKSDVLAFLKQEFLSRNSVSYNGGLDNIKEKVKKSHFIGAQIWTGLNNIGIVSGGRTLEESKHGEIKAKGSSYKIVLPDTRTDDPLMRFIENSNAVNEIGINKEELGYFIKFLLTYFPENLHDSVKWASEKNIKEIKKYVNIVIRDNSLKDASQVISKMLISNKEVFESLCKNSLEVVKFELNYLSSTHAKLAWCKIPEFRQRRIDHYKNRLSVLIKGLTSKGTYSKICAYVESNAETLSLDINEPPLYMDCPFQTNFLELTGKNFDRLIKTSVKVSPTNSPTSSPTNLNIIKVMSFLKSEDVGLPESDSKVILEKGFYGDGIAKKIDPKNEYHNKILGLAQGIVEQLAEHLNCTNIYYNSAVRDDLIMLLMANYKSISLEYIPNFIKDSAISDAFPKGKFNGNNGIGQYRPLSVARWLSALAQGLKPSTSLDKSTTNLGGVSEIKAIYGSEEVYVIPASNSLFSRRLDDHSLYEVSQYIDMVMSEELKPKNQTGILFIKDRASLLLARYISNSLKVVNKPAPSVEVLAYLVMKNICSKPQAFQLLLASKNIEKDIMDSIGEAMSSLLKCDVIYESNLNKAFDIFIEKFQFEYISSELKLLFNSLRVKSTDEEISKMIEETPDIFVKFTSLRKDPEFRTQSSIAIARKVEDAVGVDERTFNSTKNIVLGEINNLVNPRGSNLNPAIPMSSFQAAQKPSGEGQKSKEERKVRIGKRELTRKKSTSLNDIHEDKKENALQEVNENKSHPDAQNVSGTTAKALPKTRSKTFSDFG